MNSDLIVVFVLLIVVFVLLSNNTNKKKNTTLATVACTTVKKLTAYDVQPSVVFMFQTVANLQDIRTIKLI